MGMPDHASYEKSVRRNQLFNSSVEWHPILAADENPAGTWTLVDPSGRRYGVVQILRRGGEVGYRADYIDHDGASQLVGYFTTLRLSTRRIHDRYVYDHATPQAAERRAREIAAVHMPKEPGIRLPSSVDRD